MFHPRPSRWLLIILGFSLLCLSTQHIHAQSETWQPATTGFETEIKIWSSSGNTYAKVRLTFPTGGWRVDWGQVTRSGNDFTANAKVERWHGAATQALTYAENTYNLGALAPGTYTFTFKSFGVTIKSQQFDPSLVEEHWEPTTLASNRVGVRIMTPTSGQRQTKIELYFPDTGYRVVDWGQVTRSGNEFTVDVKAERWTGESQARTTVVDHDYDLGTLSPGSYSLIIKMYGTTVRVIPFSVDASPASIPKLLTEENSERAIALDSVTWLRLFPLQTTQNFSADGRTRIVLFLANVELSPGESPSIVQVQAEDGQSAIYPMTVEYVGKVPNLDWLTQVIVRPHEGLKDGGDLWINVVVRGQFSNKAMVSLKPSGGNPQ